MRSRFAAVCMVAACMLTVAPTGAAQAAPAQGPALALLPVPAQMDAGTGELVLTQSFAISGPEQSPLLRAAADRLLQQMQQQTGLAIAHNTASSAAGALRITVTATDAPSRPRLGDDESYTLAVTPQGATLQAATVWGALHGLATFQQIVLGRDGRFVVPAVQIHDAPRFPWRGLMLDVSRHFEPLPVLYRTVDAMAAVKLNVLHLHLSDDQGFRMESRRFPQLTARGSDGLFYTQQQMRDLIAYASERGVRIVPEFDMPGHVTSWLVGMPELASVPRPYEIARTFGIWDGALDPTRESTYRFLDEFIGETTALFPDEYLHLGGDESNGKDWQANPAIVAYMKQHNISSTDQLQVLFSSRALALVKKHGRQMVGWDEILKPNTPKDAVIQSWRGVESLAVAAKQGNRGILSAPYYLDAMKTSERMYLDDPIGPGLTTDQERLILGGEVAMWAEQITPETIDSRVWPRTAALAERFWSPREVRDIDDLYRRLDIESIRLEAYGMTHISGPQRGLRAIAGSEQGARDLEVLTSALTPTPFYDRYLQQKTSALTPMGNVVDYTRPDPPLRHRMDLLVRSALQGSAETKQRATHELEGIFAGWMEAGPRLAAISPQHPLLQGVALRREQLVQLGQAGMEALSYLHDGRLADAAWTSRSRSLLKTAAEKHEIVDIAVLPQIGLLVDAASGTSTPATPAQQ